MLSLILQLLFLLILLVILGEPLRAIFLRRLSVFSDLDFIQACIVDVFLGGVILFVLAIVPFGLFSLPVLASVILLTLILTIIIHFKALIRWARSPKRIFLASKKKELTICLLVFLIFMIFLSFNLYTISGLVFGSVRDESIHSLYVQVLLENRYIPLTLEPYLPEGIIYPQASHAIFAFASSVLNMEVPQSILYVSTLFKSLTILGAYFLGRKLGKGNAYALGLTFIFAFISSWPLNVTWGANPFIVGFPLYLVCLGLLFALINKHSNIELVVVGLLFGYAGAIILSYFEILIVIILLLFLYSLFKKYGNRLRALGKLALIFVVSLIPISPFLFRFIIFYQYPNHNIGLPNDIPPSSTLGQLPQVLGNISLDTFLNILTSNTLLSVLIIIFVACFIALFFKNRAYKNDDRIYLISKFALFIFVPGLILIMVSFFAASELNVISWVHQNILLSVPINIIILNFFVKIYDHIHESKSKRLVKIFAKGYTTGLLVTILVFSLLVAPFIYYRFTSSSTYVREAYDTYSVTTQSDYDLMIWMKNNLAFSDTVILVHPFGSGTFIPSISHLRIIFPFTQSCTSKSYQDLVNLIGNNILNATTYELMQYWNISYVFVGSTEAQSNDFFELGFSSWTPETFLGNPNFKLVKNFNDSYLFKLDLTDPNIAFLDDFEYANWSQNLWQFNFTGNGLGNVTVTSGFGVNGSKSLQMTSQAIPQTGEFEAKYNYWVDRNISLPNNLNATISFYLNATEDYGGKDTFALLISDINQSQKAIIIMTPNGIYQNYSNAITLGSYEGSFSYNLSEIWQQKYDSPLPKMLTLTLENVNFDGVQNVAHIDNITLIAP